MLLRPRRRFTSLVAAFTACIAMLVYATASPAAHAPRLHATEYAVADEFHDHDHGHSHDWDMQDDAGDAQVDHHHADHSHEKAGLSSMMAISRIGDPTNTGVPVFARLVGGPPFLIERPPRAMA